MNTDKNHKSREFTDPSLILKPENRNSFRKKLILWFEGNRRSLPWRRHPTPYRVWISEIMLQQTQTVTVIPYYNRFLKKFPDIVSLAKSGEEDIVALWSGLGYYSRARNIHKAARKIVRFHDGRFPTDYQTILSLPGIGRYTAGAICSIALNQPYPIVDGNIRRVLTRLRGVRRRLPEKYFWSRMATLVPEGKASSFNQAMMELGAVICLPNQPLCTECPVHRFCRAKERNLQNKIPLPKPKKSVLRVELVVVVIKQKNRILLVRQKKSFIPGQWGLPCGILSSNSSPAAAANRLTKTLIRAEIPIEYRGAFQHSITHHRIRVHTFGGEIGNTVLKENKGKVGTRWVTEVQTGELLTSSMFRKALDNCGKRM
ncbi:MAG: A/G-specific adenine glycosylase [Acidobacteriota bacterium]